MHRRGPFRLPTWAQDVLLAAFVTVMQVLGVPRAAANSETVSRPLDDLGHLGTALLIATGVALVVRRRWPLPVFLVTAVASLVYFALDFPDGPGWLALLVSLYTLTAHGDGRRSVTVAGIGIAVLTVAWLFTGRDVQPEEAIGWVFFRIGASVMSAALGESIRSRRVIATEAVERAELAERTREEEARARVDEERVRIAREVHDTVAHAIAIINVQAGVTAHVLDKRPERARETLEAIEQTSSQALREMRTVLDVLRDADDGRAPHPGLGQLDELTTTAREAGLDVKVEAGTPVVPVPSAVDSAVYRILQESITNVIRHVGPTRVTVAVDYGEDDVEVRVTDEGRRDAGSASAPRSRAADRRADPGANAPGVGGRGLLGMRERCELLGGELHAHPVGGGFEVTARLPVAPTGSTHP